MRGNEETCWNNKPWLTKYEYEAMIFMIMECAAMMNEYEWHQS